jgi:hypothetical protein
MKSSQGNQKTVRPQIILRVNYYADLKWLTIPPSNPCRHPTHPRQLTKPQHQQKRHRLSLGPLHEDFQPDRRSPSRRLLFQP